MCFSPSVIVFDGIALEQNDRMMEFADPRKVRLEMLQACALSFVVLVVLPASNLSPCFPSLSSSRNFSSSPLGTAVVVAPTNTNDGKSFLNHYI